MLFCCGYVIIKTLSEYAVFDIQRLKTVEKAAVRLKGNNMRFKRTIRLFTSVRRLGQTENYKMGA